MAAARCSSLGLLQPEAPPITPEPSPEADAVKAVAQGGATMKYTSLRGSTARIASGQPEERRGGAGSC